MATSGGVMVSKLDCNIYVQQYDQDMNMWNRLMFIESS